MHTNQIYLTGELKYPTFYAPGDKKKNGQQAQYPYMSARLLFGDVVFHHGGSEIVLPRQEIWLTISPPKRGKDLDVEAGRQWKKAVESGWKYATIMGATFTNDKSGAGRVRVPFRSLKLSDHRVGTAGINLVIVGGEAKVHDAERLAIEERYLNPFEKDKKKAWQSRFIPVLDPRARGSLHGQDVVVFGALSSRDKDGNETLYVIAEEIL